MPDTAARAPELLGVPEDVMRCWIFDGDDTPQGFPLLRLISRVLEVCGPSETVHVTKSWGYGLFVGEWYSALDTEDEIVVPIELIQRISRGTEEWFYDFEGHLPHADVLFGLHDSSVLFVQGAEDVVKSVSSAFVDTREAIASESVQTKPPCRSSQF
jgi:hypothetical protein